jgi:fructokinase
MKQAKIAGIGEILWDVLPDSEQLGGAPINFAYHVSALGAEAVAISTIGNDSRGKSALKELRKRGINTSYISISEQFDTGYVTARVDGKGVATYEFPDDVAWDHLAINPAAQQVAGELKAICFGTLAQRSASARFTIQHYLGTTSEKTVKVCDLNLRQNFYNRAIIETSLKICTVLKLNDDELTLISSLLLRNGAEHEQMEALRKHFDLELVILTKGNNGSILITRDEISRHLGFAAEVVDTIGAGDSFTAAVVTGLLRNKTLDEINEKANRLAAYVCGQPGAMPPVPQHYRLD